jgi:hypothetical protein
MQLKLHSVEEMQPSFEARLPGREAGRQEVVRGVVALFGAVGDVDAESAK